MKTLLFLIMLCLTVYGQKEKPTYEELEDIFFYTSTKLDEARDSVSILKEINKKQMQALQNSLKIQENDSIQLMNCEKQVEILKVEMTKLELPPVIEWKGFYPGISAAYPFNDSVLTKQTIIDGLMFDLTATFKFAVMKLIDVSALIGIPLRKEKFYIKLQTDYRLF